LRAGDVSAVASTQRREIEAIVKRINAASVSTSPGQCNRHGIVANALIIASALAELAVSGNTLCRRLKRENLHATLARTSRSAVGGQ